MTVLLVVIVAVLAAVASWAPMGVTSARIVFARMSHPAGCALAGHIMTVVDTPDARARGPPARLLEVDLRPAAILPTEPPPTDPYAAGQDPTSLSPPDLATSGVSARPDPWRAAPLAP